MISNQRPDTLMQDRIIQIDKSSCTARPDHTYGSKAKEGANAAFARRMAWVGEAYRLFREKWDVTLPDSYAELKSRDFLSIADSNAQRVALKYELPSAVLDDLKYV